MLQFNCVNHQDKEPRAAYQVCASKLYAVLVLFLSIATYTLSPYWFIYPIPSCKRTIWSWSNTALFTVQLTPPFVVTATFLSSEPDIITCLPAPNVIACHWSRWDHRYRYSALCPTIPFSDHKTLLLLLSNTM